MTVNAVRAALYANPDGLEESALAKSLRRTRFDVQRSLATMRHFVYIDRYEDNNPDRPVWAVVDVPPDCPKPEPKRKATA